MHINYVDGSLGGPYRGCSKPLSPTQKEEYTDCWTIKGLLTTTNWTPILYSSVQRWVFRSFRQALYPGAQSLWVQVVDGKRHVAMKRGAIQETGSHLMRYGGIGMGYGDRHPGWRHHCPARVYSATCDLCWIQGSIEGLGRHSRQGLQLAERPPVPQVHVAPGLWTAGWVADCVNISDRFAGTPCVCSTSLILTRLSRGVAPR